MQSDQAVMLVSQDSQPGQSVSQVSQSGQSVSQSVSQSVDPPVACNWLS